MTPPSVRRVPLRRLAERTPSRPDRIVYFNTWYRGHNNARYAQLLPRLDRVDPYLLTFPRPRALRGAAQVAWRRGRSGIEPVVLAAASRRYRHAFVTDVPQLACLSVPAVVDVDDPHLDEGEASLLRNPNVAAYVVTADRAARRFEELGVEKPWYVVPQGAALETLDPACVATVRGRRNGLVVGYVAAFLLLPGDRGGENPLYDVSHLLDLWDEVAAHVPDARLHLIGRPGDALRRRLASRRDVVLRGRVPAASLLAEVATFDVALYPRQTASGIRASKVAEYLAAGVPIVSYDYAVVDDVRDSGSGILVREPREFVAAVEGLMRNEPERLRLAAAAAAAGRERDWRVLAARYADILDTHLPRAIAEA
jgi:glycosyltransferase involved in cell wall biosynthesis